MVFENVRVAFAQVAGDGDDDGRYKIAVAIDKKQVKELKKARDKQWGDKDGDAKQSLDDWLTEDEETDDTLFWVGCNAENDNASHDLNYVVGDGDSFTMKDFAIIGKDSVVTIEFNMFNTIFKKKSNIGRALLAVQLHNLVPFEGGSTPTTLKGKKLTKDGVTKKGNEDTKKKKKKKKDK